MVEVNEKANERKMWAIYYINWMHKLTIWLVNCKQVYMSAKNNCQTQEGSYAPGHNTQYMNLSINNTDMGKTKGLRNWRQEVIKRVFII